jgi:hypothetical protein
MSRRSSGLHNNFEARSSHERRDMRGPFPNVAPIASYLSEAAHPTRNARMTSQKSVLAIGLDPKYADFTQFPQLTPELIQSYIDAQVDQLRALGYQVTSCLVDRGKTAEQKLRSVLECASYDCVVMGAGIRKPESELLLFEKMINLVHELAPNARICFNTSPGDTVQAVERWMPLRPD